MGVHTKWITYMASEGALDYKISFPEMCRRFYKVDLRSLSIHDLWIPEGFLTKEQYDAYLNVRLGIATVDEIVEILPATITLRDMFRASDGGQTMGYISRDSDTFRSMQVIASLVPKKMYAIAIGISEEGGVVAIGWNRSKPVVRWTNNEVSLEDTSFVTSPFVSLRDYIDRSMCDDDEVDYYIQMWHEWIRIRDTVIIPIQNGAPKRKDPIEWLKRRGFTRKFKGWREMARK